ncbi:MAG TPA: S1C family serine protease [Candidatus Fimivivens sp.]|nr:S1C family serine protease [Candidatus Fimivivens sp.]
MTKKILLFAALSIFVFVVGGIGGVFFRDRVIPSLLASFPSLSRMDAFQNIVGNTTIIERKVQMVVREDDSVDAIVSQPSTAVVDIIASDAKATGAIYQEGKSRTGVLLTNDGIVATYGDPYVATVGLGATGANTVTYRVLLHDGSSHDATLLGEDRLTNLTFFHIDGNDFPAISLANSDDSVPGTKLVAIGNSSEEYQNRFSVGVLSLRNKPFNISGKTVASSEKWEGVLEGDFPGQGAYLGGPAVNFRGEMVGLFGDTQLNGQESFFLLPSNVVRDTLRLVIDGKLSSRPTLGAYYLTLTKASAAGNGAVNRDRGALVYSPSGKTSLAVLAGSPAERAGLRYGDIVIAVNGSEINLDNPLSVAIGRLSKGDAAELLVLRNGSEITVPVQL